MRAVAKRKAWVEGEDREHNVKFSCYSEKASHLPTTTNLLAAIVTISIPNNIKKTIISFYPSLKGWNSDVATRYYHSC